MRVEGLKKLRISMVFGLANIVRSSGAYHGSRRTYANILLLGL